MPNKNAWHDHEMQQMNKGFWLMYDNAEKQKKASNPPDRLAEENRARAKAEELKKQTPDPRSDTDIQLIKVMRDLKNNHPLSSEH